MKECGHLDNYKTSKERKPLDESLKLLKSLSIEVEDDFTKDHRLLPDPQFFADRVRNDATKHAEKVQDEIVKKIMDSRDGCLSISLRDNKVPEVWHDHFCEIMNKWASIKGYKINYQYGEGVVNESVIFSLSIRPKNHQKTKLKIKRKTKWHLNYQYWMAKIFPFFVFFLFGGISLGGLISQIQLKNTNPGWPFAVFVVFAVGGVVIGAASLAFCGEWAKHYKKIHMK